MCCVDRISPLILPCFFFLVGLLASLFSFPFVSPFLGVVGVVVIVVVVVVVVIFDTVALSWIL